MEAFWKIKFKKLLENGILKWTGEGGPLGKKFN